jgi:phosphate-selective porin OprO/OprP
VLQGGPVQLTAESGLAREERSRDTDGNPATPRVAQDAVITAGAAAELAWMITGQHRRVGAWPWDARAAQSWGAWEIALRAERFFIGLGAQDVSAGGAMAGSAAVHWWANDWFALALAGYLQAYDRAPVEEPTQTLSWIGLLRATVRVQ